MFYPFCLVRVLFLWVCTTSSGGQNCSTRIGCRNVTWISNLFYSFSKYLACWDHILTRVGRPSANAKITVWLCTSPKFVNTFVGDITQLCKDVKRLVVCNLVGQFKVITVTPEYAVQICIILTLCDNDPSPLPLTHAHIHDGLQNVCIRNGCCCWNYGPGDNINKTHAHNCSRGSSSLWS